MMRLRLLSFTLFLSMFFTAQAWAAATLTLHGKLINLTCKIGNDQPIDIDFGDEVVVDLLDGQRYQRDVPLQITCNNDYKGELNFTVSGTASFEDSVIETTIPDLGIRFLNASSNKPIEINKAYPYKNNDNVDLIVVPVKAPNAKLTGGDFNASAQLLVEPQ